MLGGRGSTPWSWSGLDAMSWPVYHRLMRPLSTCSSARCAPTLLDSYVNKGSPSPYAQPMLPLARPVGAPETNRPSASSKYWACVNTVLDSPETHMDSQSCAPTLLDSDEDPPQQGDHDMAGDGDVPMVIGLTGDRRQVADTVATGNAAPDTQQRGNHVLHQAQSQKISGSTPNDDPEETAVTLEVLLGLAAMSHPVPAYPTEDVTFAQPGTSLGRSSGGASCEEESGDVERPPRKRKSGDWKRSVGHTLALGFAELAQTA